MLKKATLFAAVALFAACESTQNQSSSPSAKPGSQPTSRASAAAGPMLRGDDYEIRGAGVHAGPALATADVLAKVDDYNGKDLRVTGTVNSVCKKKGCWMRLGAGEQELFVRFKDYGFFVPLDCEGREVVMEGNLKVETMSVADQKHYLEDAGKHAEAKVITEPKKTVMFMATGVALTK